jgi:UDP-glucose 4-epimerase
MSSLLIIGGTGYIGSQLYWRLITNYEKVDTVDVENRGNFVNSKNLKLDYNHLTANQLRAYDVIILLAGHSNVRQSIEDPFGAIDNNLAKFVNLIGKLDEQKLLYASSSSVYTGVGGTAVDESWNTFNFSNMYDFTKYACDGISSLLYKNSYALRFGTVCGTSPNIRPDLMINAMVKSGLETGTVRIFNGHVRRPILGINDLCDAVERILSSGAEPGIYNLCSFNATVNEIATRVARRLGCDTVELPPTDTYDFSMENRKAVSAFGFAPKATVESLVDELVQASKR